MDISRGLWPLKGLSTRLWGNLSRIGAWLTPKAETFYNTLESETAANNSPSCGSRSCLRDVQSDCCWRQFLWHPISNSLNGNRRKRVSRVDCFTPTWENIFYHRAQTHIYCCCGALNWCSVVLMVVKREREGKPFSLTLVQLGGRKHLISQLQKDREFERDRERKRDGWMDGKASWAAVQENEGIETEWLREKAKEKEI